ncbi:MAG: short-chain dehydrogenase [Chitinophagaceae bacterium]|nr:short-chain dehydrogenase [Chitinophagaceae bacterium]
MIEKFLDSKKDKELPVNIHFKERNMVSGLFIYGSDYNELKSKNFWRIVSKMHMNEWLQTKNGNLAKIYNGISFTKLTEDKHS